MKNEAYTVTIGDQAENGVEMETIGTPVAHGLSVDSLRSIARVLPGATVFDLTSLLDGCGYSHISEAAVLVARGGINTLLGPQAYMAIVAELRKMPKDTETLRKGVVQPNRARHNCCIADYHQAPDIANGKGTVVRFSDYPHLQRLREALAKHMGARVPLMGEVNHYYSASSCGIGWHGDAERKLVAGARFGPGAKGMPFKMQWFYKGAPVGKELRIELNAGDVYILSDKAVGYDTWSPQGWSTLTLRHAAGKDTYAPARTKRARDEENEVVVFHPPAPLSAEQTARIEANKK